MTDDRLAVLREQEREAILRDQAALERAVQQVLEAMAARGRELEVFRQAMADAARRLQPALEQLAARITEATRALESAGLLQPARDTSRPQPRVREHGAPRHVRQPAPFWTVQPTRERRR